MAGEFKNFATVGELVGFLRWMVMVTILVGCGTFAVCLVLKSMGII